MWKYHLGFEPKARKSTLYIMQACARCRAVYWKRQIIVLHRQSNLVNSSKSWQNIMCCHTSKLNITKINLDFNPRSPAFIESG